jgi:hypothetical protein
MNENELENKIHDFLTRKNHDFEIKQAKMNKSKPIFDFSNDSLTFVYK